MFGRFAKRRAVKKAKRLIEYTEITQALIFNALLVDFHEGPERPWAPTIIKATAATNFLFGKAQDPAYKKAIDLPALQLETLAWLRKNGRYRELVVQSLRISEMAARELHHVRPITEIAALRIFGAEFQNAPSAEDYEYLVKESIACSPPEIQSRIRPRWANIGR